MPEGNRVVSHISVPSVALRSDAAQQSSRLTNCQPAVRSPDTTIHPWLTQLLLYLVLGADVMSARVSSPQVSHVDHPRSGRLATPFPTAAVPVKPATSARSSIANPIAGVGPAAAASMTRTRGVHKIL